MLPPPGPTTTSSPIAALGSPTVPPQPPGCTKATGPTTAPDDLTARGTEAGSQTITLGGLTA
jgi:hypothetical protein